MDANETDNRDARLWMEAKKRAGFKSHLISFMLVNALLWVIWWFTVPDISQGRQIPWPLWPLIGWGIGLTFHYVFTYLVRHDGQRAIEREYEKLVNKNA